MNEKLKNLLLVTLTLSFFLFSLSAIHFPSPVFSETLSEIQKKIDDTQAKISELQGQEKTLSSQIAVIDNQIKLTSLKIDSVRKQISDLTLDIDTTDKKIGSLEGSLDNLTKVLLNRIKATYVTGSASSFQALLASNSIEDFVKRANYLRIAQAHDKRLMYDTVQAKNDYENQKQILEDKKKKVISLKSDLESYTEQMSREKSSKDELLKITKNDEATYQQKLKEALAEQRAIQQITSGGGNVVSAGPVSQGGIVGTIIQGASPCSTGTHLHFEVRVGGGLVDPKGYLSSKSVSGEQLSFSGSWPWPISDPVYISQDYGMTAFAQAGAYGGGPHTGIDMNSSSSLVHAVKNGELSKGSISCGGGQLRFSKVDHGDGTQTYYLHVN